MIMQLGESVGDRNLREDLVGEDAEEQDDADVDDEDLIGDRDSRGEGAIIFCFGDQEPCGAIEGCDAADQTSTVSIFVAGEAPITRKEHLCHRAPLLSATSIRRPRRSPVGGCRKP
ncbi:MAG: hypothetical protein CL933_26730 [Deltaproteobacteria bacterium]|nr:hypothetical protein [Deltaproteobacteria bacterium]